jgi:hypothetical protein
MNEIEKTRRASIRRDFFKQFPDNPLELTISEIYARFKWRHLVSKDVIYLWLKKEGVQFKRVDLKTMIKMRRAWKHPFRNDSVSTKKQLWYR